MTTNIPSLFDFNGHSIRVVQIDNAPWFVAADVCKALGIVNTSDAMTDIGIGKVRDAVVQTGRCRPNKIITEAGAYLLVFHSRKPEAKEFQDWVTGTVLVAIRKDGGYIMGEENFAASDMTEAGVHHLVFHSRTPDAKAFQDWVTGTVLVAIRKDGGYIMGEENFAASDMTEDDLIRMFAAMMRKKLDRAPKSATRGHYMN